MFKIEDDVIKISRATRGVIEFTLPNYTFVPEDTIEFRIYEKNKLDQSPVRVKTITTKEQCESLIIDLTCEDMDFGTPSNKPVDYWYEIILNGNQMVKGYDDITGAKILKLYPKGVDE